MRSLVTIWKFSRPHTITGSVVSIFTLYSIVCEKCITEHFFLLAIALTIGVTCNIFIVGINQIADVEIDRINKPYLPLAAGTLTMKQARMIVNICLVTCLALAGLISVYLFGIIALSAAIGWAYSMPPFYLRQHHLPAALAITTVRGVAINAGGFLVFNNLVNHSLAMPENLKILTLFIIVFSIAIAWFKDLPDMAGDARYNIRTFAILYSSRVALVCGHILVATAYLFTIWLKFLDFRETALPSFQVKTLLFGHIALFLLFLVNGFSVRLNEHDSVRKFYKRFWLFFFGEYLLYLVAYL